MDKYYIETFVSAGFQGTSESMLRALIMLDAKFCRAAVQKEHFYNLLDDMESFRQDSNWSDSFEIVKAVKNLLKKKRLYFYVTFIGENINKFGTALRGTIHARLLWLLSVNIPRRLWKEELQSFTLGLINGYNQSLQNEIIDEYVDNYWDSINALTPLDLQQLKSDSASYEQFSEQMLFVLEHLLSTESKQTVSDNDFLMSKINRTAFQCMVEAYLIMAEAPSEAEWNRYLNKNWEVYFPSLKLTSKRREQINDILELDSNNAQWKKQLTSNFQRYSKALGVAICNGNIQKIRSDSYIRSLTVHRTVAMVVSLIEPENAYIKQIDEIVGDIIAYLSYVNYIPDKAEEADIMEILDTYLENGRFNTDSVRLLNTYKQNWKQSYQNTREFLNQRNRAVSVLNDKIDEMEVSLAKANYDTLKQLIIELDRGSFGYQLGKMYRLAFGIDTVSVDELVSILKILFHQFNNMGIKPVAENQFGQELYKDSLLYKESIPEIVNEDSKPRILLYPGWSLNGTVIAQPVYKAKED